MQRKNQGNDDTVLSKFLLGPGFSPGPPLVGFLCLHETALSSPRKCSHERKEGKRKGKHTLSHGDMPWSPHTHDLGWNFVTRSDLDLSMCQAKYSIWNYTLLMKQWLLLFVLVLPCLAFLAIQTSMSNQLLGLPRRS